MSKVIRILTQEKVTTWFFRIALLGIILVAFCVRLYKIDNPIADWHSWRQADTSSVSRHFAKDGVNLLIPRFDDLSNIPSGKDNPQGYRFVEFPFYNLLQFLTFKILPSYSIEFAGRLVSILLSMGSVIFLYLLNKLLINRFVGLLASLFFAVLPFSVYYGRVILPEPLLIFSGLGMAYFFLKWIMETHRKWSYIFLVLGIIFGALSLLIKPFVGFYFFPVAYVSLRKKIGVKRFFLLLLAAVIILLPFILWRKWMSHFPEGIPDSSWLFNSNNIRFKGAFFYWIFAERIGRLILGYWGLIFLGLGIIAKLRNDGFFVTWLLGALFYLFLVATGNVNHDYYQVILLPIISSLLAKGAYFLLKLSESVYKSLAVILSFTVFMFTLGFSWYSVRGYYNVNRWEMMEAGKMANEILPKEAKVIAPLAGDTSLLYQTNRSGWPEVTTSVEDLIKKGATHYVSVNFAEVTNYVMKNYRVLFKNDRFVIVELAPVR